MVEQFRTLSPEETRKVGLVLAPVLRLGDILLLEGELGSGKTVFVSGIAEALGAKTPITSPSFTIIQEYSLPSDGVLRHVDLYRISNPNQENDRVGLAEILSDPDAITIIEWADRLEYAPRPAGRVFSVAFHYGSHENERKIAIRRPVG